MNPTPPPARLLTVDDVAERLFVSSKTVRRWLTSRMLPSHRFGRQLRITEEDLSAFIAERRQ